MLEQTEEQREMEEQAIALKWRSDSRGLKEMLKISYPHLLDELHQAKYFADEYIPTTTMGEKLFDIITASFIQDLPYSKWQTAAITNVKKILSPSKKKMLEHWQKDRKDISSRSTHFSKDRKLTPLVMSRIYAFLNKNKELCASISEDAPPSVFSKKTLLNLIDALPFFEEPQIWSDRGQKLFEEILVHHLCRELISQKPAERFLFVSQQLIPSTLREENDKKAIFKIGLLGKVVDTLNIPMNKKELSLIVKNLQANNRTDVAKKVRKAFHLDSIFPLSRFFQRTKNSENNH